MLRRSARAHRPSTRAYVAVAALVVALLSGCTPGSGPEDARTRPRPTETRPATRPAPRPATGPVRDQASLRAVRVLERWEADRAAAYRHGDVRALRALHAPGSAGAQGDVAVLRAYAARGFTLGLRTVTDRLAVLLSEPSRVVLRRRARVEAVALRGGQQRALPSAGVRWQRLVLELVAGSWRLRSATPEPAGSPRAPP